MTGVQAAPAGESLNEAPDPLTDFVIFVFNDTQSLWEQQFGQEYQPAELVLFSGGTQSACGFANSGVGPALLLGRQHRSHRHRLLPRALRPVRSTR